MRNPTGKLLIAVALSVAASACTKGSNLDSDESDETDDESDETNGPGETGDLSEQCEALLPDPPGAAITFTIRNDRSEPIYIDPRLECGSIPFWLLDPDYTRRIWWSANCLCACESVLTDESESCLCQGACEQPALHRIDPGASWVTVWDARIFDSVAVPDGCAANPGRGIQTCDATRSAESGEWTAAVGVWPSASGCVDDCACEAGQSDCPIYASGDGELLQLSVGFTVPDQTEVLILVN